MPSNPPADDSAAPPAKGKKKLLIIGAVVFVLLLVGGGGAFWMMSKGAAGEEGEAAQAESKATVPTFLPLENMVVNLADAGGERFVQLGITLEVGDEKTADQLKKLMPSVRSTILMLVSQRTAEDLLRLEGKEKLATDIQREAGKALGFKPPAARAAPEEEEEAPRRRQNPVRRVLFSSFIIQ
ncbi:MAG: flagellar basal body-associated FliL family protein [Giesbergeria sp.]|uniref:flagellar basal body-associated FliL family protein n=1 Tax=Giesbergeria sp. TaxID=2818473 RepID=UPI00262D3804|nr:flagellar basal body-associated FliL family protein [Giesbergeria sp.]MDD2610566.1 flagellar basal body-associated FliL family protein [Giesbergeria sp.]